jgi:hypothetical protein
MKCPHCEQTIEEQTCPHCHAGLMDTGPYCGYCGRRLEAEPADATDSEAEADNADTVDPDWDSRVLCSDGNCIGVIGADGRCKVCGKPLQDEPPRDTAAPTSTED